MLFIYLFFFLLLRVAFFCCITRMNCLHSRLFVIIYFSASSSENDFITSLLIDWCVRKISATFYRHPPGNALMFAFFSFFRLSLSEFIYIRFLFMCIKIIAMQLVSLHSNVLIWDHADQSVELSPTKMSIS